MKYAIIICVNGSFRVDAEFSDLNAAKVAFHDKCKIHWNSSDVYTCMIMIADENLDAVEGYKEFIHHDPAPALEN